MAKKNLILLKRCEEIAEEAMQRLKFGESLTNISKSYGIVRETLTRYLTKECGYVAKPVVIVHDPIQEHMIKYAHLEYLKGEKSMAAIASEFNIDRKLLSSILKERYDVKVLADGKKQLDDNFFAEIDAPEKAYWLGFLYADGYNDGTRIELALQESDKYHVELFRETLKSKHTIGLKNIKTKSGRIAKCWRISMHSKKMAADLEYLGCGNNKSLVIEMPKLPDSLMSHFIRGYFDGDGSIMIQKTIYCRAEFSSGSIEMLSQLGNYLKSVLPEFEYVIEQDHRSESNYRLRTTSTASAKLLISYLYNESEEHTRLARKYARFIQIDCRPESTVA